MPPVASLSLLTYEGVARPGSAVDEGILAPLPVLPSGAG